MSKVEDVKRYMLVIKHEKELELFGGLSSEAQEVIVGMVAYCLNHGIAMGQDEGLQAPDYKEPQPFRKELELLVARLG